jgi:hypothetical protein
MGSPCYMVLAPVVSVLADLHLFLFTILWLLFLLCLILLLSALIKRILLVFLLPALVVALSSLVCKCTELGIQLELAHEGLESGNNCHNFFFIWRVGSSSSFGLEPGKLVLG